MPFGHQVSRETLCPLGQPEKAIGEKSPIEPWLALHNHSACCVRNRRASLREHDESAEKEQSQSLVTLLGLDGKTIFPVPYRRGGAISLDIPFYRTDYRQGIGDSGCAVAPNSTINSSTPWQLCASKRDGSCWPRAGNIPRLDCSNKFLAIGPIRAALLIALIQNRTASVPGGDSGPQRPGAGDLHQRGIPLRGVN